jgi:outer membrane lipoprotein-sorting protein
MRKSKYTPILNICLFIILNIVFQNVYTQESFQKLEDVAGFKHAMKEASESTQNISSDFTQLKHLSFLEEDVKSKGLFYFQKENRLRWEYTEPFFYLIIFNNDTILIRNDKNTNLYDAASGRMFREINNIMLNMVNGSILESHDFTFEYFENSISYKLELTPQDENMKEFLTKIRLIINKNDYSVDELFMIEKSDDYTHIRFINKRLNEDIPQHTFDLH